MSTLKHSEVREILRKSLMVPVFYNEDYAVCEAVVSICFEEGIELFEFTNRGAKAKENFERLQQLIKDRFPGKLLGIGTIKTAAEAEQFVQLKPDFVVSPLVNPEVGRICADHDIAWMPGCLTPTEVFQASENGAAVVKIFPASSVGPVFIKSLLAVFPDIYLMPTGGIRPEKAVLQEWFSAGVLCVGMGSELLDRDMVKNKNWNELREKIRYARQQVQSCTVNN